MSFNEDQYSPNRPNSHRKNNRQLIVGAENKASRPTSFLNPNNVEAPKGYHVMPGGNLMSDALHKMMCGGEHKKLPKAMFGMTTGHEDPPNEPTAEQKRKAAIEFGRNLQSTLEYPRNFDKWETVDWSKVGHGQKVPKIFINKDFDKSYISVPQAGKVYFKDMTEATYPEGYIGDTRYFIHGDNKIIPYNVNPKELGLNWRMNKRNEFFSDLRDIKAMEYQQKFGDSDYVNPENTTFATGGEVMELTDEEIQKLRDGGAVVMELDLKKKDDTLESMANGDEKKKKKQTAVISSEGVVKNIYSKEPFDINYRQLGPQEATWTLPGPYASEELKSQEEFVSDIFNKYGEVAKPYTVEFDELVVYPTDELKGKQEKLIKSYEDTFKKLWQYGAHEGLGLPKSNRIKDLEKWNKDASAKVKELDQRHNKTKADVEKIRKKLGYENAEDVLSVNGLNDFRKLYKDKKISSSEFMSAYENYLKYYDPNMVTLSKEDRQELENIWNGPVDDQGRRRWIGKPRNVTKVGAGVALAAPFAPFIPAALANPLVQAGLTGYGVYDAATNRLPQAYRDFSEGNYGEGFLNLGSAALDLMPGMVFDDMYRAGKAIKQPLNQLTNPFKYRSEIKEAKTAYNDLLKALSTPEGARRLKTMGIDNPQDMVAPKLKISFGDQSHYNIRENVISFNPKKGVKLNENRLLSPSSIINHEGGHWIQREALFQNALKQHAEDLPKFLEANKVSSPLGKKVVSDLHKLKTPTRTTIGMGRNTNVDDFLLQLKQNKGNLRGKQVTDYDYFTKTHEPFAFAREMRQNMVDMGIIKHPYDPISKDEIAAFMLYQNPSRSDRMSSFLIPNEHNVNLLHTFMNNAPAVIGTAGVGTGLLMNSNYADGGEVMELTDKEIQELRKGGHIVIES